MIPAPFYVPESKVEFSVDLQTEEVCSVANKLDSSRNDLETLDKLTANFQKIYIKGDSIDQTYSFLFLYGTIIKMLWVAITLIYETLG